LSVTTPADSSPRPRSPWTGSRYETRHRWQLDQVTTLAEATEQLRQIVAELTAADAAGWWLVEPMASGHLLAARASRRERATSAPVASSPRTTLRPRVHGRRLRLVNERPVADDEVFDAATATRTPVVSWAGSLRHVSGPEVAGDIVAEAARQLTPAELAPRLWGLATARVGPGFDLVADGSALRLHTVRNGVLLRTHEVLTFQHAADGAAILLQAAAAYERVAGAADAMAAEGGRLVSSDAGLLEVRYQA
jgi:hypothetical protein